MSAIPMLPRGTLPDPGQPAVPERVVRRWDQFLGAIAAGDSLQKASKTFCISEADVETMTRLNPVEERRFLEARTAARKREWSIFTFEEIFRRISEGANVKDAIKAAKGTDEGGDFYAIINADPGLKERYEEALQCRALAMSDALEEFADDDAGDIIAGPKGDIPNMAAVNRSKLQVDTRWRLMSAWHSRMFGEKGNKVDVNVTVNHAQVLEDARARAKERGEGRISREEMKKAVDATFSEIPAADADTSWMDEKPADTTWREES